MPNLSSERQHHALVALGRAIREARMARGLSQEKLALLAEIDRSYMGRIERGDNNVATLTLLKICAALKLKAAQLMFRAEL